MIAVPGFVVLAALALLAGPVVAVLHLLADWGTPGRPAGRWALLSGTAVSGAGQSGLLFGALWIASGVASEGAADPLTGAQILQALVMTSMPGLVVLLAAVAVSRRPVLARWLAATPFLMVVLVGGWVFLS